MSSSTLTGRDSTHQDRLLALTFARSRIVTAPTGAGVVICDVVEELADQAQRTFRVEESRGHEVSPLLEEGLRRDGIRPTAPGFATFQVKPQPTSVTWADVTVPTDHGTIGAAFDTTSGGRVDISVNVPANTTSSVYLPGGTEGTTSVFMDGNSVAAAYDNGFLRVDDVQPGCHIVTTSSDSTPYSDTKLTGIC
ncbi:MULTISPECIES: alpha-L-rhamnosidase C-terminal domain-containing protein [Streptomyces]|uniref:Alpha-L-rhamnosidase C-terminal domain-containing protein n=1 Tax=Streptomyces sviceus (strain ATCC 29083 / DSM 924 / JCM 4929 / NBRC 13980 / NCIMB 11184 / NRRL 5439 / UC 5370) TaxID=463191 RepID=B5HW00_STRX2|nr:MULTISPECIES: alpha-L-rhamnosidase C-terminal domain-containing protein [Streptomyces]EDY57004.1 conserved hypothetical protein [Streptomyces sviceus ATCC 29083]MYT05638.1 hypothetical protein [Streptomyces sp. SID5470]